MSVRGVRGKTYFTAMLGLLAMAPHSGLCLDKGGGSLERVLLTPSGNVHRQPSQEKLSPSLMRRESTPQATSALALADLPTTLTQTVTGALPSVLMATALVSEGGAETTLDDDPATLPAVWCGGHGATTCEECTKEMFEGGTSYKDHGETWCHEDCQWNGATCSPTTAAPPANTLMRSVSNSVSSTNDDTQSVSNSIDDAPDPPQLRTSSGPGAMSEPQGETTDDPDVSMRGSSNTQASVQNCSEYQCPDGYFKRNPIQDCAPDSCDYPECCDLPRNSVAAPADVTSEAKPTRLPEPNDCNEGCNDEDTQESGRKFSHVVTPTEPSDDDSEVDPSRRTAVKGPAPDAQKKEKKEAPTAGNDLLSPGLTPLDKDAIEKMSEAAIEEKDREAAEVLAGKTHESDSDFDWTKFIIISASIVLGLGAVCSIISFVCYLQYLEAQKAAKLQGKFMQMDDSAVDGNPADDYEGELVDEDDDVAG